MQPNLPAESATPSRPNPVARFFLWCSGSDPELLVTPSERTRQLGLGTLVVVPAVLALFAMTYALSTITTGWVVPILGGIVWAAIVFAFDRYVVSTLRKSSSIARDTFSPVFLTRLALAVFIGFLVAHPLVLLYFEDSIEGHLDAGRAERGAAIEASFVPRIAAVDQEISGLRQELEDKERLRLEAQGLLAREIGGIESEETTGRYGRGPVAEAQEELRRMAELDLERLASQLPAREAALEERRQRLEQDRARALAATPDVRDYIARTEALAELRQQSTAIATVQWFLIFFFVFVDTLPLVFKALTPRGPYDERLEVEELTARREADEARAGLTTVFSEIEKGRTRAGSEIARQEGLPHLWERLQGDLDRHQSEVRERLRTSEEAISTLDGEAGRLERESHDEMAATGARVTRTTLRRFERAFLDGEDRQSERVRDVEAAEAPA